MKGGGDGSEQNSEFAEPSPGPSGSSETPQPSVDVDEMVDPDDKQHWPSITDLNTRLRRVITSYQRNYRKEEQKLAAQKAAASNKVRSRLCLLFFFNSKIFFFCSIYYISPIFIGVSFFFETEWKINFTNLFLTNFFLFLWKISLQYCCVLYCNVSLYLLFV